MIRVCNKCIRASCHLGVWPCDARDGKTILVPRSQLVYLDYELPIFWDKKYAKAVAPRDKGGM